MLLVCLLGLCSSTQAQELRRLHWSSLDVTARLDGEGVLHVVERHGMVFTGDWNGGERVFRLTSSLQRLELDHLTRIEPGGARRELVRGGLAAVDEYQWFDENTLRWRARLPSDPPFDATEIVYEIAYAMSFVVSGDRGSYYLDHDFAFPNRPGVIEAYRLHLELDPEWEADESLAQQIERSNLAPGESVVLRSSLRHRGSDPPLRVLFQPSVDYKSLEVEARLDAEGRLRVNERHHMVLWGDVTVALKNFSLQPSQKVVSAELSRVDPATGESFVMSPGDSAVVDQYFWFDSKLVWSHRGAGPPFAAKEIVYQLSYVLDNILTQDPTSRLYTLRHDLARPVDGALGNVAKLSLELELDPVWEATTEFDHQVELAPAPPGYAVLLALSYGREDPPQGVERAAPFFLQGLLLGASLLCMISLYFVFRRDEMSAGRYRSLAPRESIDETWLRSHLFDILPEEAGAIWDDRIGGPEVAAVLARLVAEKKISTEVSAAGPTGVLHLTLDAPRTQLAGYERSLVDALFLSDERTDSTKIRSHYEGIGFDPASRIRPGLQARIDNLPERKQTRPKPSRRYSFLGVLAGLGFLVLAVRDRPQTSSLVFRYALLWLLLYGFGLVLGRLLRRPLHRLGWYAPLLWAQGLALIGLSIVVAIGDGPSLLFVLGMSVLPVASWHSILNSARTRSPAPMVARRQSLAAARRFFRHELRQSQPRIDDAWYPYLIALGLGGSVDRWFRVYRKAVSPARSSEREPSPSPWSSSSSSSPPSRASAPPPFTGGGGAFGGAGATGSWAAVATTLAAGVPRPAPSGGSSGSSSSFRGGGGSSSGGGGGRSGGGGGGGW